MNTLWDLDPFNEHCQVTWQYPSRAACIVHVLAMSDFARRRKSPLEKSLRAHFPAHLTSLIVHCFPHIYLHVLAGVACIFISVSCPCTCMKLARVKCQTPGLMAAAE